MKSNRIPVTIRLMNRINKLYNKVYLREKIFKGNPYLRCVYCKQSEPYISIEGHHKGCPEPGILKEIAYYKKLLEIATIAAIV